MPLITAFSPLDTVTAFLDKRHPACLPERKSQNHIRVGTLLLQGCSRKKISMYNLSSSYLAEIVPCICSTSVRAMDRPRPVEFPAALEAAPRRSDPEASDRAAQGRVLYLPRSEALPCRNRPASRSIPRRSASPAGDSQWRGHRPQSDFFHGCMPRILSQVKYILMGLPLTVRESPPCPYRLVNLPFSD